MRLLILVLMSLGLLAVTANAQRFVQQDALRLEPDYDTLQLYYDGPRTFEPCNAWPIKPHQPRPFNLRGQIFSGGDEVGRYYVRGVIRQADGAHVADYALTIRSIGTIVFALDALPDVGPFELDLFVSSGARRNDRIEIVMTPRLTTDCTWGHRWDLTINFPEGFK